MCLHVCESKVSDLNQLDQSPAKVLGIKERTLASTRTWEGLAS